MHRWVPLCVAALWPAAHAGAAAMVAQSGFNDAAGINSNITQDSPYTLGQTVDGRGSEEPGWAGPWSISRGGGAGGTEAGTAQAAAAFEGDGGLALDGLPSTGEMWAHRSLAAP